MDQARMGQQGTLTRIRAKRSTRPRAVRDHRCTRARLFGAVCPARGTGAAVVLPYVDAAAMDIHVEPRGSPDLAEVSRCVSEGAHAASRLRRTGILDGAGRHASPRPRVPESISLPPPRHAPEPDPMESLWEFLRQTLLSPRAWDSHDAIVDACCHAWTTLTHTPEQSTSITTRTWAQVSRQGGWHNEAARMPCPK